MVPHTIYGMQEHCNCQWLMVSPYLIWKEPCNWIPPPNPQMYDTIFFRAMQCRNLVTVNDLWSLHTLYGRNLETGSHHMYNMIFQDNAMQEPCNCQWLMVPPYLIWNVGTCNLVPPPHVWYDFLRTMQCRNLVTVNDLWSPIRYMECRNLVTGSPTCTIW